MVGILVSIWVLSIVICATAAGNLIPLFKSKINEISKAEEITRTYDQKDFDKLYIKGKYNFKIKQGTNYSITMTGRSSDLDRVAFKNENKQLEITQNKRNTENKICVFCFDKEITGEITMPKLDSFVGVGDSEANISGFKDNIYLSVGEVNSTEIALNGQNVKAQIAGVDSELEMTGTASTVSAKLIGVGEISTYNFKAGNIDLDMDNFSRAKLIGEVNNFKAELRGTSELSGLDFSANKADVITKDFSRAEIWAKDKLTLVSQDNSSMVYKNTSASLEKNILDNGSIEVSDSENKESQAPEKIHIKTETDQYSPAMSSIRGMGLTVSDNSNEPGIYYLWKTDRGYFVKDWQAPEKAKEMSIHFPEDKIYWTYFPSDEKIEKGAAVNIYLEKREKESENTVDTDQVLLKMGDYGKIFLVK